MGRLSRAPLGLETFPASPSFPTPASPPRLFGFGSNGPAPMATSPTIPPATRSTPPLPWARVVSPSFSQTSSRKWGCKASPPARGAAALLFLPDRPPVRSPRPALRGADFSSSTRCVNACGHVTSHAGAASAGVSPSRSRRVGAQPARAAGPSPGPAADPRAFYPTTSPIAIPASDLGSRACRLAIRFSLLASPATGHHAPGHGHEHPVAYLTSPC